MKILTKLALAAVILTTTAASQAEIVRGHFRSNGIYVAPYYRTPANGIPYDNLSYRGYPSQQPGYVSPRSSGLDTGFTRPSDGFSQPARLPSLDSGFGFSSGFNSGRSHHRSNNSLGLDN